MFRIGTVRYAEGLWRMHRHRPVIAHCTDSEDFPKNAVSQFLDGAKREHTIHSWLITTIFYVVHKTDS